MQGPAVLIAEDDEGQAILVEQTLRDLGLRNPIRRFADGQAILDYLLSDQRRPKRPSAPPWVLLLDIRMPKLSGVEVLRQVKANPDLRQYPVVMLSTTDDPREVARCHELGCTGYIQKPVNHDQFSLAIGGAVRLLQLLPGASAEASGPTG